MFLLSKEIKISMFIILKDLSVGVSCDFCSACVYKRVCVRVFISVYYMFLLSLLLSFSDATWPSP